ncbi:MULTISPECIES: FecR family protein [Sanguibacteroides]|uniref:DUF4974 domain-containing protein n=1 Tax=Sanguibacteroides justesenii TaxID=1547597 RepID=A0AB34R8C1_9PORP|nr:MULTISPECIES: FecR domain-containing protein [Sanguibacteroides]KIO47361.1 hypothetical protein IE90_01915 [Sanguibacteroides justesenii]PXZ43985.1 DUF4974 domain-containing protein [Sanguibacteroides justesenii]
MVVDRARLLAEIIIRVKLRRASLEEREELGKWLDESDENRQLYKSIIRGESIAKRLKLEDEINRTTSFDEVHKEISGKLLAGKRQKRYFVLGGSVVAASVVVACMLLIFGLEKQQKESSPVMAGQEKVEINPAKGKVMLVLENGKQINLSNSLPDTLHLSSVAMIGEKGKLSYRMTADSLPVEEVIHKIVTTVGGDYQLVLSDGTKVWLNAESEIDYPIEFLGDKREVFLKGEAYFEVAPDPEKPFIVKTTSMQTRVLGTSFNINAYENEPNVYTTLLTGKVEVMLNKRGNASPVVLKPAMQLKLDKESGDFSVEKVRVEEITAWRYGVFMFAEDDIEVVTRMLSRWYDVKFVFDGERKGPHTFSGRMSKDDKLNEILKMLTLTGGPEFKIEGNTVHIIEK